MNLIKLKGIITIVGIGLVAKLKPLNKKGLKLDLLMQV